MSSGLPIRSLRLVDGSTAYVVDAEDGRVVQVIPYNEGCPSGHNLDFAVLCAGGQPLWISECVCQPAVFTVGELCWIKHQALAPTG
jgi:hypothetical protein